MKRKYGYGYSHPISQSKQAHKKYVARIPTRVPRLMMTSTPAVSGAAHLRSRTRSEVKSVDIPSNTVIYATTGSLQLLNGIQEGSSFFNRIGRRVCMKSVEMKGFIETNPANAGTSPEGLLRTMIIYDRQTNGALPAVSDVLLNYDNAGVTTTDELSGLNLNNRERFTVIYDNYLLAPQVTNTAGVVSAPFPTDGNAPEIYQKHVYRKLRGVETHFKSSTNPAVVGDITTGGLYLLTISSLASAWQFTYNFRVRFWDD